MGTLTSMEAKEKKGINFKQTPEGKEVVIQPETFQQFIEKQPRDEKGWVVFSFDQFKKLNRRGHFATVAVKKAS